MENGGNIGGLTMYRSGSVASVGIESKGPNAIPAVRTLDAIYIKRNADDFGETFRIAAKLFRQHKLKKISVSGFGPFGSLFAGQERYGEISKVMTHGSAGGNNIEHLARQFFEPGVQLNIVTDANALALGEACLRGNKGLFPFDDNSEGIARRFRKSTIVSLLFGKGIGGGISVGGNVWNGRLHPEMGHLTLGRLPGDRRKGLGCDYHNDCVSALAARAALTDKNGAIPDRNWDFFTGYAARLCVAVTHVTAPSAIVLSGSTIRMKPEIVEDIRGRTNIILNDKNGNPFLRYPELDKLEKFISIAQPESQVYGTMVAATDTARGYLSE